MSKIMISLGLRLPYLILSLYFMYKILKHINATELIWFLYILLIFFGIIIAILDLIMEDN